MVCRLSFCVHGRRLGSSHAAGGPRDENSHLPAARAARRGRAPHRPADHERRAEAGRPAASRGRAHLRSRRQPHGAARGGARARGEGARGRAAEDRHARAGARRLEHPRPRRPQLARRGIQRQQVVRGDDRGAAGDRAPRRATCRDEGDGGRDLRDRRGVRGDGGRRRRPGRIPRRRPALPRPDSRRVATTSSSATSESSCAPCFERRSSSRRRRSGPVAGRSRCTRRSSTTSSRETRRGPRRRRAR